MNKTETKSEVYTWIKSVLLALLIVVLVRSFLLSSSVVMGESMSPTFEHNDRLVISKISDIERFDMVVFHAPDADDYYVKRVIGLPGDTIEIDEEVLYVNGEAIQEPYIAESEDEEDSPITRKTDFTLEEMTGQSSVPDQNLFVLGDNRMNSKDSRFFGFIHEDDVIGKVKFRYFPFTGIGIPR